MNLNKKNVGIGAGVVLLTGVAAYFLNKAFNPSVEKLDEKIKALEEKKATKIKKEAEAKAKASEAKAAEPKTEEVKADNKTKTA
jgi:hypothetical protein